jgi:hypothetical protein
MRVLRNLTIAALAAIAVTAALPAMASAGPDTNRAWTDDGLYFGDNNPGDYDDPAVLEVSGELTMTLPWTQQSCDITGEIELWNHWPNGTPDSGHNQPGSTLESPARNKITSLETVDSPYACTGLELCPSPQSPMSFSDLPWVGKTTGAFGGPNGNVSSFNNVEIDWCTGAYPYGAEGTLRFEPQYAGACIESFDVFVESITDLYPYWTPSGSLNIDDVGGILNPSSNCLMIE